MTPYWKECRKSSFNVTGAKCPLWWHSNMTGEGGTGLSWIQPVQTALMLQLPHLKHRGTKKKKRGLGQDASCYCSSFGTHSQSFSLSLPSLSPSAGEQPATITDLLKLGTYVHFFFLLTHSLLTASKVHWETEKVLGSTGPPFFSLYSTNVVFQKAQTNPQCSITFFFSQSKLSWGEVTRFQKPRLGCTSSALFCHRLWVTVCCHHRKKNGTLQSFHCIIFLCQFG